MKSSSLLLLLILISANLFTQEPEIILPIGHIGNINTVSFSKDNKFVLTSSEDRTAKIWDARRGRLLHNLEGHTDVVNSAAFSSDGNRVITISRDKTVKTWDALTGELVHSSLSPVEFQSALLSPTGKSILSRSEDVSSENIYDKICLWDFENANWRLIFSLTGSRISYTKSFIFSPDNKYFAFLSDNGSLKNKSEIGQIEIADAKTGKILYKLEKLEYDIPVSVDFSPDGMYFLTSSEESTKIWDIKTEKLISTIPGAVFFSFSNDGKNIAAIISEGSQIKGGNYSENKLPVIKVYEISSGKVLYEIDPGSFSAEPIETVFSPDDTKLMVTFNDYFIKVLDIRTHKILFVIDGRGPAAFSPDGRTIVSSANSSLGSWSPSLDQVPKIWDAQTGKLLYRLEGHTDYVSSAAFSPDGKKMLTGSWPVTANLWDINKGKLLYSVRCDSFATRSLEFSPDGKYILTASEVSSTRVIEAVSGKVILSFTVDTLVGKANSWVNFSVKFSPDSKTVISSSTIGKSVKVYDLEKRKLKYEFESPFGVKVTAFNAEGTLLGVASRDGSARVWNMNDGTLQSDIQVFDLNAQEDLITANPAPAKISPDGKIIITFPSADSTGIWDASSGRLLYTLGSDTEVPENPFSSDSKKLVTLVPIGSNSDPLESIIFNKTIIRDVYTGLPLQEFKGEASINHPLSPDNSKIVTITDFNTACLWDAVTGNLLRSFPCDFDKMVYFSSDGSKIITRESEKISAWDIQTGKMIKSFKINSSLFMSDILSKDGKFYLNINPKGEAVIWDMESFTTVQTLSWNTSDESMPVSDNFNLSPDGSMVFTRSFDGTSKLGDSRSGKVILTLNQQDDIMNNKKTGCSLTGPFSYDSKKILGDCEGLPLIWDIENRKILPAPENAGDFSLDSQFTPDDKRLMIKTDSAIKFWDVQSGKFLNSLEGMLNGPFPYVFSPDGNKVLATSSEGTTSLWDVATGKLIHSFDTVPLSLQKSSFISAQISDDDQAGVRSLVFSPDGKYLATTSGNDLKIWDTATGTLSYRSDATGNLYNPEINEFPFSPDSKTVAVDFYKIAGQSDDTSQISTDIIDIKSGEIKTLKGFTVLLNGKLMKPFAPDGKSILTLSEDNKFKLWDTSHGKLQFNIGWDDKGRKAGSAFFSPEGKNILTSSYISNDKGYIIRYEPLDLWNTSTGKLLHTIDIGSEKPAGIYWKNDLINSIRNSIISLYDIKTGKKKVSFVAIDNDDYVFLLPSGEYMGTSGGVKYLSWKLNNKIYDFDQWDLQYNRPDKVLEQLNNQDTALISMYRKAYFKRLKRSGFSEEMFGSEWHTPETKILNPEDFATPSTDPVKQLKISLADSKYKLDRLNVWINDVPQFGKNGISLRDNQTSTIEKNIPVRLSTGINKIQVSCLNEKGVESLKESVEIAFYPVKEINPDLYVIAMSVSTYKDNRFNLQYAVKDGRDITSLFSSKLPGKTVYNSTFIDTLFNRNATKENFFTLRQKLLSTNTDDQVVVFISGHGLLNKDMDFYFATYDIDFNNPEERGISFDDLERLLDSIPARKKLMMIDACHSGEVDKEEVKPLPAQIVSADGLAFRGNVKEYNFKGVGNPASSSGVNLSGSFELMQELFTGLDKGTGTIVISAAAGKGYALESPQWNNGVFTYSIINGIKNNAADANYDKKVTISELKEYSINQVDELTGGRQKPTARKESVVIDWKVW